MVDFSPTAVQMFLGGRSHTLRGEDVRSFRDEVHDLIEENGIALNEVKKVRVYKDRVDVSLPSRVHTLVFQNRHVESFQDRYYLAGRVSRLASSGPVSSDLKGKAASKVNKLGDVQTTSGFVKEVIEMSSGDDPKLDDVCTKLSALTLIGLATGALGTAVAYEDMRNEEHLGVNKETQAYSRFKFRFAVARLGVTIAKGVKTILKLVKSSLPGLKIFGRVIGGFLGVTSFIGFGSQLYTFVKKERFYSKLKDCTRGVQDEAEKAQRIFKFLQSTGQINQERLESKKEAFSAHGTDREALDTKLQKLEESYRSATGYRFKTIGAKVDSARQWIKGKLGLSKSASNAQHNVDTLAKNYMDTLHDELRSIERSESDPQVQLERKHALLDAAHMKIHKEEAMNARAKEISLFASSALAEGLSRSLDKVDIHSRLDQKAIVQLHSQLLEERRGERFYDVVAMTTNIVNGIVKVIAAVNPTIGVIIWMGHILTFRNFSEVLYNNFAGTIARGLGIDLESEATKEVKAIFERFKQKRIIDITHIAARAA